MFSRYDNLLFEKAYQIYFAQILTTLTRSLSVIFIQNQNFDYSKSQNGGGSGFGLYIAKAVVTLHDGIIWAESDGEGEGKGAVFCVQLPLSKVRHKSIS